MSFTKTEGQDIYGRPHGERSDWVDPDCDGPIYHADLSFHDSCGDSGKLSVSSTGAPNAVMQITTSGENEPSVTTMVVLDPETIPLIERWVADWKNHVNEVRALRYAIGGGYRGGR